MSEIYYIYPRFHQVSFTRIAKEHIKHLNQKMKVYEIDEEVLDGILWLQPRNILLHPILYTTIGDNPKIFEQRQKRLKGLLKVKGRLGGFETADSDKISPIAVETLRHFDLIFLPSTFAKETFMKSGVKQPMYVIPHGINETLMCNQKEITNPIIKKIQKIKERDGATLVLHFLMHSDYRKGSDLVYKAMKHLQTFYPDLYLVVKHSRKTEEIKSCFKELKLLEIKGWLSDDELRQLYDVCDICIVPSRGGGFELNALEAIARGLPTIVPKAGCFMDYIEYAIPVSISDNPTVFPDNPIHIGKGWEINLEEFIRTIEYVYIHLNEYKEKAKDASLHVKEKYNWKTICENLYQILKEYKFCD